MVINAFTSKSGYCFSSFFTKALISLYISLMLAFWKGQTDFWTSFDIVVVPSPEQLNPKQKCHIITSAVTLFIAV